MRNNSFYFVKNPINNQFDVTLFGYVSICVAMNVSYVVVVPCINVLMNFEVQGTRLSHNYEILYFK